MNDRYYTPSELAKILRVNPRTIVSLIRSGKLEALDVGTGKRSHWRIYEGQYRKFLASSYNSGSGTDV